MNVHGLCSHHFYIKKNRRREFQIMCFLITIMEVHLLIPVSNDDWVAYLFYVLVSCKITFYLFFIINLKTNVFFFSFIMNVFKTICTNLTPTFSSCLAWSFLTDWNVAANSANLDVGLYICFFFSGFPSGVCSEI